VIPRGVSRVLLAYPPLALVAGSLVSDAPAASITVALVVLYVACLLAAWWPGFLVSALAASLVAPVLAAPHLGYWAVLLALPALGAVVRGLHGIAPALIAVAPPGHRSLSPLALSIGVALVVILLIAIIVSAPVLAIAGGTVLLALGTAAAVQRARLGPAPLLVDCRDVTARAGRKVEMDLELLPAGRGRLFFSLAGEGDAVIQTSGPFSLAERTPNVVTVTPELGGPSEVVLCASIADAVGLVHMRQDLHVARLNVIPRARVARWAAEEFLEHRGGGPEAGGVLSREVAGLLVAQGGVEYVSSRAYVPGDSVRSIDWKHTTRTQSLVVKSFDDGSRSAGLLLVNLSATDAVEADRLVYEFLSAALTVATLSYGASIAVYGGPGAERDLSPLLFGDSLVRASLGSCADVRIAAAWRRYSRPVSLQQLHGQVARVRGVGSPGAAKLSALLALKERALKSYVEGALVGQLLQDVTRRGLPAWCVAISAMHRDAEAVLTGLHDMELRGVRTRLVDVSLPARGRATGESGRVRQTVPIARRYG
jgi:hypothetical protein